MLITNKHVSTEYFIINVSSNRIERTLVYKYLGVIVQGVSQLLKQSDWAQIQDFK